MRYFFVLIGVGTRSIVTAICFVAGAAFSTLAGYFGMQVATKANVRTANAAMKSGMNRALSIAFSGGAVMGLCVAGLGVLGVSVIYLITGDIDVLSGFSFGASSIALFARVGGGIYTKAADVGADLVGKVEAGIPEIVLVRGYLGEQFDVLKDRYPNIKFLNNPMFNESNNISSVLIARDYLAGAYVMEADLLLANPRIVRKYEYCSNYLGEYRDMTDDWCFDVKKGLIKKLNVGGTNCYHMFGISYWTREDGKRLADCVEKTWKMPGGKERYWDEVPLRTFQKEFEVAVRPCEAGIWWRLTHLKS